MAVSRGDGDQDSRKLWCSKSATCSRFTTMSLCGSMSASPFTSQGLSIRFVPVRLAQFPFQNLSSHISGKLIHDHDP